MEGWGGQLPADSEKEPASNDSMNGHMVSLSIVYIYAAISYTQNYRQLS